jgi:hypothetical protein
MVLNEVTRESCSQPLANGDQGDEAGVPKSGRRGRADDG